MSEDDPNTPKLPPPWDTLPPAPEQEEWGSLPGAGDGWGPEHEPTPLHQDQDHFFGQPPGHSAQGLPRPDSELFVNPNPQRSGPNPYGQGPQGHPLPPMHPAPPRYPMQSYQPQGIGAMQPYGDPDKLDTDDILAIALTLVLPGTGHMIVGQPMKGLATIFCFFISCGLAYLVVPFMMYDVYLVSKARKRRAVGEWEVLPK